MYDEYCIDVPNTKIIGGSAEGEALKLKVLSFLGDVDSKTGTIISEDTGAIGHHIKDRILVIEKFRGSTVGVYVLYSLCRKRLAPKAIISNELDPVVIAGIVLCNIVGVFRVPENIMKLINNGDVVKIRPLENGARVCIAGKV